MWGVEAAGIDFNDSPANARVDQTKLLRLECDRHELRARVVQDTGPLALQQLLAGQAFNRAQPQSSREGSRGWVHPPPNLANTTLEVAGLRPGAGGVASNLVEDGLVEAGPNRFANGVEEGRADELRAKRELQDRRSCGAQEGIPGQGTEQGDQGASAFIQCPQPAQDHEDRYGRVEGVKLPQPLVREPARGRGLLAEDVLLDDGLGVGGTISPGGNGIQEFGNLSQHHRAAGVSALFPEAEAGTEGVRRLTGIRPSLHDRILGPAQTAGKFAGKPTERPTLSARRRLRVSRIRVGLVTVTRKKARKKKGSKGPAAQPEEQVPPGRVVVQVKNQTGQSIQKGALVQISGHLVPSPEPGRSPLAAILPGGVGKLVPLLSANPTHLVLAFGVADQPPEQGEDQPEVPSATFFVSDAPVTESTAIENALANPARELQFMLPLTLPDHPAFGSAPLDPLLLQFSGTVIFARGVLDRFRGMASARNELVEARELLGELEEWSRGSMVLRSGADADAPLEVPERILAASQELWKRGRRLRYHWDESVRERANPVTEENGGGTAHASVDAQPDVPRARERSRIDYALDFSWLRVEERTFHFRGPTQRAVIRILFEERERAGKDGCGMHQTSIGEAIDENAPRLAFRVGDYFRDHEARDTILRRTGKGMWALFLDEVAPR